MANEGQVAGKPDEGQALDNQEANAAVQDSQPELVELPDGTKVSADELKAGYMKQADYTRKTMELAEERKRLSEERERTRQMQASPTPFGRSPMASQPAWAPDPDEEVDPMQALAQEVTALKVAYARDYLNREIERQVAKFPDMDKKAVFDACWSNPNAVIEDEAARSHNEVARRISERTAQVKPQSIEDYFKANPKAKEEYDRRLIEQYHAKKTQQGTPSTGGGSTSASSGGTFHEEEKPVASYGEATKKLRERILQDESF